MLSTLCVWNGQAAIVTADRIWAKHPDGRTKLDDSGRPIATGQVGIFVFAEGMGSRTVDPAELEPAPGGVGELAAHIAELEDTARVQGTQLSAIASRLQLLEGKAQGAAAAPAPAVVVTVAP